MFTQRPNDFGDFTDEKNIKPLLTKDMEQRLQEMNEVVFPVIKEHTIKVTNEQKEKFDKKYKQVSFPDNSYVMTQGGSYILKDERGDLMPKAYPPSALKLVSQEKPVSEDEIFKVEAIVAHKEVAKGQYLYKVRWRGYKPEDDMWEPATNFQDPRLVTQYWDKIKQKPDTPANDERNFKWKSKTQQRAPNKRS
ncbi:hypothetical protein EC973_007599 [Apophysomyces ossiformis]|uniref:Chromo domain-containing protein n=1 Tax=Apophysomyces ossiformis TaxID=679940 RepID=A0A8H7BTL6_9FUNG|nr:hypothetical protein EC973_007599 [Apophysomyces ossiformis]